MAFSLEDLEKFRQPLAKKKRKDLKDIKRRTRAPWEFHISDNTIAGTSSSEIIKDSEAREESPSSDGASD
jgi:hypothetical protein